MKLAERIAKLRKMTVANGCTPAEAANAKALADMLETKPKAGQDMIDEASRATFRPNTSRTATGTGQAEVKGDTWHEWVNASTPGEPSFHDIYEQIFGHSAGIPQPPEYERYGSRPNAEAAAASRVALEEEYRMLKELYESFADQRKLVRNLRRWKESKWIAEIEDRIDGIESLVRHRVEFLKKELGIDGRHYRAKL